LLAAAADCFDMSTDERIRLWLLCCCSEFRVQPKHVLCDEEDMRSQWNDYKTEMTNWNVRRISDLLVSLVRNGEIRFWEQPLIGRGKLSDVCLEDVERIHRQNNAFKVEGKRLCFGFTDLGADNWEAFFRPDWNYFHLGIHFQNKILIKAGSSEQCFQVLGAYPDYM